jgi:hypothetical protein
MPEITADLPDPSPETGERRQFLPESSGDSLYKAEVPASEVTPPSTRPQSSARTDTAEAAPAPPGRPAEPVSRFVNQEEDPFDDYRAPGEIRDFGALTDEIAARLEANHIVILYGSETHLTDLAFSVVCLRFPEWLQKSFDPHPRTNHDRQQDVMTLFDLIESPFLTPLEENKLLVVQDLGNPNLTPLVPHDYTGARGTGLLARLKACPDLRVLVITRSDTWNKLTREYGGGVMSPVGKRIELEPRREARVTDQHSIGDRINDIFSSYGKPGFITVWCIALLPGATLDDIVFVSQGMIRHWRRRSDDREDILEQWRMAWPAILARLGARQVERSQAIGVELPNEACANELRRLLRVDFRMLHLEAMTLMRQSKVLLRAEPDLLQIFALSMARLAKEERQPGRSILVHLIEEWLQDAADERTLYLLTALFCAIVRDDETAFASDALAQLPGNGYPDAAAAVLVRCPARFVAQPWYLTLYNRILPSLTAEVRLEMWSRLIRLGAARAASIGETVTLAHAHLKKNLYVEFVARFAEELLLGDRDRAARLLALLRDVQAAPASPGRFIFETIRSADFREYADRRANRWTLGNARNALFDTWIVRTIVPIVPSVSPENLIHLFGQALYGDDTSRATHVGRASSPADQVIAMLLMDYGCETPRGPGWEPVMATVVELALADHDGAFAVYETLRGLAERFSRVSRVLAVLAPDETSLELSARTAIRKFFDDKSEIVDRLQRLIEAKYFKGA